MSRAAFSLIQAARIIAALKINSCSYADVATLAGVHVRTAMAHMSELHEAKMIYVDEWGADSRGYKTVMRFMWGSKPDASRPPATSSNKRVRAFRARKKLTS